MYNKNKFLFCTFSGTNKYPSGCEAKADGTLELNLGGHLFGLQTTERDGNTLLSLWDSDGNIPVINEWNMGEGEMVAIIWYESDEVVSIHFEYPGTSMTPDNMIKAGDADMAYVCTDGNKIVEMWYYTAMEGEFNKETFEQKRKNVLEDRAKYL